VTSKILQAITVVFTLSVATASASPIIVGGDPSLFYDLALSVQTSLTLIPGQVGFLQANIFNTGSLPIAFKDYDPANPIGGYGYDFNSPGAAIGSFGYQFVPGPNGLAVTEGHVDPLTRRPFSCCIGSPNFSNLNGVVIQPGTGLSFDLLSFAYDSNIAVGTNTNVTTAIPIAFGSPIFAGFNSGNFTIPITAGENAASGNFSPVSLTNFTFSPAAAVPEPSTLFLVCSGLAASVAVRRRVAKERQ